MARQTFSWYPNWESEKTVKPEVTVTKFGDGYEARQAAGLNFRKQVWDVTFEGNDALINAIDAFLNARGAVESFYWTTPKNETLIFVCDEWRVKRVMGYRQLTGTFRQVFEV